MRRLPTQSARCSVPLQPFRLLSQLCRGNSQHQPCVPGVQNPIRTQDDDHRRAHDIKIKAIKIALFLSLSLPFSLSPFHSPFRKQLSNHREKKPFSQATVKSSSQTSVQSLCFLFVLLKAKVKMFIQLFCCFFRCCFRCCDRCDELFL